MTSTFRTAGCGSACPVVWEGTGRETPAAPIPISEEFEYSDNSDYSGHLYGHLVLSDLGPDAVLKVDP